MILNKNYILKIKINLNYIMRKLFFIFIAAAAMSFTACNKNAEATFGAANDSTEVDTTVVDSVAVDTVAVDSVTVDSVAVDSVL
jgi:hypothetical protein